MMPHFLRLAAGVFLIASAAVQARDDGATERVQFERGTASKVIKGSIKGYAFRDYVIGARAGQVMTVNLRTSNGANYFNVLPPGSDGEAIFIGSTNGDSYRETLEKSGDYKVRVYLMRSAARRNEVASYSLTIGVEGRPAAANSGSACTGHQFPRGCAGSLPFYRRAAHDPVQGGRDAPCQWRSDC